MDSAVLRVLALIAVLLIAGIIALVTRRARPHHPPVTIDGLDLPAGIVVFTSTDCPRCREVLELVKTVDVPLREVTYEIEGALQRRAGVVGVPVTLIIADSGNLVAQLPGRFRRRALVRAVDRAGF